MPLPRALVFVAALSAALAFTAPAQTRSPSKASAKTTVKSKSAKAKKNAAKPKTPPRQMHPTPERYAEIEQALLDRGYLPPPADGKWDKESVEALKRFQRDQSLKDDGKLGALTLTALGLGPKRASVPAAQLSLPAADD